MRILVIANPAEYDYAACPRGWFALPHFFRKFGHKVLTLTKSDHLLFLYHYFKFKPDVIVSSWVPAGFYPAFFRRIGIIRCPVVHAWDDYYAEQMKSYPYWLVSWLERYSVKNADLVTTVSRYNEHIAKEMGKKVEYIPHGIESSQKPTKIRLDKLKLKKGNIKIVYLGEQSTYKKVNLLIDAMRGLPADLFLLGSKNEEFARRAPENVHFVGSVSPSEVQAVLRQADILANPSDQDSNFKLFEYIAARKPILAFDGKPSYLFTHKVDAYLAKDFRAALIDLIRSKELRAQLTRGVSKMRIYTWSAVSARYVKILQNLTRKE